MNWSSRIFEDLPTSSFSSVMGIGIVSDAFFQIGILKISKVLEIIGLAIYTCLILFFLIIILTGKGKFRKRVQNQFSILGAFTFIAGTSVIFTRLSEGGYYYLDIPVLVFGIAFSIFLIIGFIAKAEGNLFEKVDKPYLFLVPFIAMLSLSVLSTQTYSRIDGDQKYFFAVSVLTWVIGVAGIVSLFVYAFKNHGNDFLHPERIDGFYMVYSGIASLSAFSAIIIIKFYTLMFPFFVSILSYYAVIAYGWTVVSTIPLFFLYALRIKRGHVKFRYKVSIWGSVFPLGINSTGSYFVSLFFHQHFLVYLAYFYAFMGLLLIIIAFSEIIADLISGRERMN
ncbi:hypothetical protein OXIME_000733 [Oxyplasma meridianum]|uniref:C4-dicarboxylate ABC transporter n=1 Tax=Oxyplasma meridianum TaxID=3073602 RepID=A0AAX4NFE4_9ARCH